MPVRKAPVQSTGSTNAGGRGATGLSQCHWAGGGKVGQALWETVWCFCKKLSIFYPVTQQPHSLVFTQRNQKLMFTQKPAQRCL